MGIKIKRKLGERIVKISDELNIPRITVERVIRSYLDGLVESAKEGETIVIDNIMSIKLVENVETGDIKLRGRVSPSLKNKLYVKADKISSEE
jgi:nucleoid DNA-binding protein